MNSTGITRKVDGLGRIVLPKDLRDAKGIGVNTLMEIFTRGNEIVLKKYAPYSRCTITGEVSERIISLLQASYVLSLNVHGE
ncbi:AbrB family transcriptional regulator [Bacillus nakamurai]|uniref:AbrB family transcriptional regulator n=1 Tax=Bacillus nakamurai TaxID=1793963 RepID=A0A150F6E4_9BACI|nr:AbrB/MazE/SpoVT family DNA-binding domain-containing protein [Bacillus nakamurai]KXZ16992.1 AbrB family transcriptional regulator [Bacillus nakamurai]